MSPVKISITHCSPPIGCSLLPERHDSGPSSGPGLPVERPGGTRPVLAMRNHSAQAMTKRKTKAAA